MESPDHNIVEVGVELDHLGLLVDQQARLSKDLSQLRSLPYLLTFFPFRLLVIIDDVIKDDDKGARPVAPRSLSPVRVQEGGCNLEECDRFIVLQIPDAPSE